MFSIMGRGWYVWTVLVLLNPIMINFHRALDKSWNLSFILNLHTFLHQNMKCIIDLNLSFLINSGCEASFRIEYESPSIFIFSIFPIVMEKVMFYLGCSIFDDIYHDWAFLEGDMSHHWCHFIPSESIRKPEVERDLLCEIGPTVFYPDKDYPSLVLSTQEWLKVPKIFLKFFGYQ